MGKKRIARSQQPDVCRAIPLHNYLPDIRDLRAPPASAASVSSPLSLIVSSSLSALSRPFLPPCRYCFFISSPTYSVALAVHIHYFIPPHSLSCQKTCILLSFFPFVAPPASAHTSPIIFYPPPPFSLWPPCFSLPCLLRFMPPSLVIPFDSCQNITPLPGRQQHRSLFAIQIVSFFGRLSPAVCMWCIFAA